MSRHLLIRCDRAGCPEQVETRASDIEPTSIEVPGGWLTLHESGLPDRHYCSLACVAQHLWSLQPGSSTLVPLPSSSSAASDVFTATWNHAAVADLAATPDPYAAPAPVQPSTAGPKRSTHKKPQ